MKIVQPPMTSGLGVLILLVALLLLKPIISANGALNYVSDLLDREDGLNLLKESSNQNRSILARVSQGPCNIPVEARL